MQFTPSRLSVARSRRGLTKRKLATLARVSEKTVASYESGATEPNASTLDRIARVLRFPVPFFSQPELEAIPTGGASFRAMSRMTAAQRLRALASGALAYELYHWIDTRFVLPEVDVPSIRLEDDAEAVARSLRVHWGLGEQAIGNMIALLESKGVRVYSLVEECKEVDAFSLWRGDQPFMFLNTFKSAEHSRFDAAHELAHLVLHRHAQPGREAERQADAFASAFLMPRDSVKATAPRIATMERLIAAKHQWKVSLAALIYRTHAVGMLTDWYYQQLCIQLQQCGFRTHEPEPAKRELSQVFERVFSALKEDGISRSDLAQHLNWPVSELNALVFQLVVSGMDGGNQTPPSSRLAEKPNLRLVN